jgi:peptide/nickel transport system substrate-binding protein
MSASRLYKLVTVLLLAVFVLSSCQQQTEVPTQVKPADTKVPTKPADTEVVPPTEEPTEVVPPVTERAPVITFAMLSDMDGTNVWYLFDTPGASYWNYIVQAQFWPTLYSFSDQRWDWVPFIADGMPSEVVQEGEFYVGTAKVRQGVVWSNGEQVTAADVAFTAEVALAFRLQENWSGDYNPDYLVKVEAVDELTAKFYFNTAPGLAIWQYGALNATIVNKNYWEPKVADLLVQAKALDVANPDYAAQIAPLTEQLEALDNEGEPVYGAFNMRKWEVGAYIENVVNEVNAYNGLKVEEFVNGTYRESKADVGYEFTAYGDPTGDKSLDFTYGPYFDSAMYSIYDQDAAILALLNGDVDFILNPSGLPSGSLAQLREDPSINIVENPQNGFRYIEFNQSRAYLGGDPGRALRQAIACQIDLNFLTGRVLNGSAIPVYTLVPRDLTYWHNPNVPVYCEGKTAEERLNESVRILKEAGFTWEVEPSFVAGSARDAGVVYGSGIKLPDGTAFPEITLQAPGPGYDPLRATSAVYIEQWIRQLGVPVTTQYTPFNTILANQDAMEYDIIMLGWGLTPFPSYLCDFFTGATGIADGSDKTGWINPVHQADCAAFQLESDLAKAREIAFKLQENIAQDLPYITIWAVPMYDAYRNLDYPFTKVFDGLGPGIYGAPHLPKPAQQ